MRVARKAFKWPRGTSRYETRTREVGFFAKTTEEYEHFLWDETTWEENLQDVNDFVDSINPQEIISINEYRKCEDRLGDDRTIMIVIWDWIEDALTLTDD